MSLMSTFSHLTLCTELCTHFALRFGCRNASRRMPLVQEDWTRSRAEDSPENTNSTLRCHRTCLGNQKLAVEVCFLDGKPIELKGSKRLFSSHV